jgi:uncharacterized membrane protein
LTAERSAKRSYAHSADTDITPVVTTSTAPAVTPAASGAEPEAVVASRTGVLTRPRLDPYWLAILLFAAYAALSICRFRRMATMSWDLGIFEQAVRAYAHLQAPIAEIRGPGVNILGDHFSPITALIAPFYRVFPTPITLLTAQAALFALSAVPVTRAAARLLGRRSGLAIGIAYGLSWGIQRAVDFDFHEICFAVPLIAFALEAVLRERWRTALLWAAPLVLVKEDLGLTTAAISLIVLLRARRAEPRAVPFAVGMIVFGVVACAITFTVVIPAFNAGGSYDYWNKLGENGGGSPLTSLLTNPNLKVRTLLWILLPTSGLLALRSPLLLAALPTLAWRFVSNDDHYWGTDWHYNATLMPIAFLALTDAIPRAHGRLRSYAGHLPAATLAAALALSTTLPLADLTHTATYQPGLRAAAAARVLGRIPDGATVEGNVGTVAHLTNRTQVFWVGDAPGLTPSFIALDQLGTSQSALLDYAKQLHPQATYTMLAAEDGYWVMMLDVKSTG